MWVSAMYQHESATVTHTSAPWWTSPPSPAASHLSRLSQSTRLSSMHHTASSPWLSTLHMTMYMFGSISLHWSQRNAFLPLLANLWNSASKWVYLSFSPLPFTSLLYTAISKASSDNHFAFLHFFFLGMVLIPTSCTMSWTSINSSSGTLIRYNPLESICHFHCIIIRDLI